MSTPATTPAATPVRRPRRSAPSRSAPARSAPRAAAHRATARASDGPMVGRFRVELSFPIPDGGCARHAGDVAHAVLAAAIRAGALPEGARLHLLETRARPRAQEERRHARAAARDAERRTALGLPPRPADATFVVSPPAP